MAECDIRIQPAEHGYVLDASMVSPRPVEEVFAFFSDPANLARLTPPWLGFTMLAPAPVKIEQGTEIDYSIRVFGFRVRWRSRIDAYEPPVMFRDVQVIGPYRRWAHTHKFVRAGHETEVIDHVEYNLPLGPIGALMHAASVERQLREIFTYRCRMLAEIFH
jgi:ligand-binding SRPBCC domain-containing protein